MPERRPEKPKGADPEARRPSSVALQHVALSVSDRSACERFYCEVLGMRVLWRPDDQNVYLTSGNDNLALHQTPGKKPAARERLDHIGFAVEAADAVDAWHDFLLDHGIPIVAPPRTHRDGTRSLYCKDPDGNTVQLLYEPRLAPEPGGQETVGTQRRRGRGAHAP